MNCSAKTKAGNPCGRHAVTGATVCAVHGGSAPQVKAMAAVRAEVSRWQLGDAVDDPGEVLLRLVTQSRMRVEQYAAEIERKVAELGPGMTLESVLVGDTLVVGEFSETKVGEYIRGLVQLEAQERDRLAAFCAKAIAAGLAERTVRMAERQGEMLAAVLMAVIGSQILGLSDAQRKVFPDVVRAELATLRTS